MYTDAQLRPSFAQAIAGTGTLTSTNTIDLLSANRNLGRGQPMRLIVTVDTAFTGGTGFTPRLVQSPNADLSGATTIGTGATAVTPAAGVTLWDASLPDNTQRYIGFQYDRAGTYTAGAVSAHVLSDTDYQPYLPSVTGYT
jgi:hypothetical protein